MTPLLDFIKYEVLEPVGRYAILLREILSDFSRNGADRKELFRQMGRIGADSMPIVLLTAIFTGMVLALQTAYGLQRFGAKNYVGNIVGLAMLRELGPVLTAIVLCGRVGAGVAAEISSMVVTEQVDAMRALGANPIAKLVTPRVVAAMIVVPLLVVFANYIGIIGGVLVAVYELNITLYTYYRSLVYTIFIQDFVHGMIKASAFGFLVVSIACYKGMQCRGGTEGVGRATTSAVVTGSMIIFVADYLMTKLLILLS